MYKGPSTFLLRSHEIANAQSLTVRPTTGQRYPFDRCIYAIYAGTTIHGEAGRHAFLYSTRGVICDFQQHETPG